MLLLAYPLTPLLPSSLPLIPHIYFLTVYISLANPLPNLTDQQLSHIKVLSVSATGETLFFFFYCRVATIRTIHQLCHCFLKEILRGSWGRKGGGGGADGRAKEGGEEVLKCTHLDCCLQLLCFNDI